MTTIFSQKNIKKLAPFGIQVMPKEFDILNLDRTDLLKMVREHKIILFRDIPALKKEDLLRFCADDSEKELLHWDFGPVMEMKADPNPKNYLFSKEKVPYHWDGAFHTVPSYLVFNCLEAPTANCGGETIFCNTEMIFDDASNQDKSLWRSLEVIYNTEKKAHYGGRIQVPMVQKHPHTQNEILRYSEAVKTKLNPVTIDVKGNIKVDDLVAKMKNLIYDSKYCLQHKWQEGDLLVADNHALIHGRNAFIKNCPRHLRRIQIL